MTPPLYRHDPGVVVEAIGARRDCLRVLRESVKDVVARHWDCLGKSEKAHLVKGIMASGKEYFGSGIKEWTASWEDLAVVWRLQRKKVESKKEIKKRRTKC